MFILILLGIITAVGIVYMAVSRKSTSMTRFVAICALALMVITVIICLLFIFEVVGQKTQNIPVLPDAVPSTEPDAPGPNLFSLIALILFLLTLFALVLFRYLREQRRAAGEKVPDIVRDDW